MWWWGLTGHDILRHDDVRVPVDEVGRMCRFGERSMRCWDQIIYMGGKRVCRRVTTHIYQFQNLKASENISL